MLRRFVLFPTTRAAAQGFLRIARPRAAFAHVWRGDLLAHYRLLRLWFGEPGWGGAATVADHDGDENEQEHSQKTPVIVAIGASAGGVNALQGLFGALPERTGAAFVVVVHLDPERRSEMPQILAARTKMPVVQVHDGEHLLADHVYVIPPDRQLQLFDHQISVQEFDDPRGQRTPIDLFFRSMAERLGDG